MFTYNDLLSFIQQRPFIPFRVVTTDGTTYEIQHPEMLMPGRRMIRPYPRLIERQPLPCCTCNA